MQKGLIYISLILLMFTACHSSKNVVSKADIKQLEMSALYDSMRAHYGDYSTISFKFAVDSKEIKSLPIQIKGSMRIKKDSIIWISVAPTMNIEVLRCVLTKDSVKCYSKLQKTYYASSLDSISRLIGIECDYQTIQSILLDELFFCQQGSFDTLNLFKALDINKKDNKIILQNHSKKEFKKNDTIPLLQTWQIATENFRVSEVDIVEEGAKTDNERVKIKLSYSNFETNQNISFPTFVSLKSKLPNQKVHVDLQYSKINFNENLSFPFNLSSSYQKMDLK